ncbi:MAG: PD-(D/E)XK nuclease family protein [Vicinamibacterales bacterium]
MQIVLSPSAAVRIDAARQFVLEQHPAAEVLIVGATRGAADDFARVIATTRGATFGLHRFSLTQLAARLAAPLLAAHRQAPATGLGIEAVAARAAYEVAADPGLGYFGPVATSPGFPRALARTLEELALAGVRSDALGRAGAGASDLAALLDSFDRQFDRASTVDRAAFLETATRAAGGIHAPFAGARIVLLDVAIANAAEAAFVRALLSRAAAWRATLPAGDVATLAALDPAGRVVEASESRTGLDRVRNHLFEAAAPPKADRLDDVELFSAPGEGREAVEIVRRVLREARAGVPFDAMAVAVRAPYQYAALLEHAFERAGVPVYFERGTRRPHPAGRAFLALLACAQQNLSATRFAEYLSLGQVPDRGAGEHGSDVFPASLEEEFGTLAVRGAERATDALDVESDESQTDEPAARAFRAPWRWERLLAESRVVAAGDRWSRRLHGLIEECRLQQREIGREDPESPRIGHLERKIEDLQELAAFVLPIMRSLSDWPVHAKWGEWLERFDLLARQTLRRPDRVLRVLADLKPMATIGPVRLAEAARVLAPRLGSIETDPPPRRYGRVFVGTPHQLRGRTFDVVFVPALAERVFPQKLREDPLLLDAARARLPEALPMQGDRTDAERLQLRLAVGAAVKRLYVSFPTIETGEGRPRVPSLYALEIWRAMTGRVPSADELQQAAARASGATLAWPAPADGDDAIDALEHDLATLRRLVGEPDHAARGKAQYLLQLNEYLQRSVRERYMRSKKAWTRWDGIAQANERTRPILAKQRLAERVYSLSALQRYATCPYQFLLGAIYRLRPAEDLEPLQRMDPLTKGSLFHAVQTAFYRRLQAEGALPIAVEALDAALRTLDECLAEVAAIEHDRLAPAIERVWADEIGAIRRDLRLWVDAVAHDRGGWVPIHFEWAFGIKGGGPLAEGRDPASIADAVAIDGRFLLHGSVDLVEEHATTKDLRVTDHKTGRYRGKDRMIINGGGTLQPVLYSLALEAALGRPVAEGRLYYATTDGGFRDIVIKMTDVARRSGVEALEIIDRAIESGFLAPAPNERACTWCDFAPVCGPHAERRSRRKAHEPMADLLELRRRP